MQIFTCVSRLKLLTKQILYWATKSNEFTQQCFGGMPLLLLKCVDLINES